MARVFQAGNRQLKGASFQALVIKGKPVVDSAGPDGLFDTSDDLNDRSPNYRLRNELPQTITLLANLAFLVVFACWLKTLIQKCRRPASGSR